MNRFVALIAMSAGAAMFGWGQTMHDFAQPESITPGTTIVLGFLGGFEKWNDPHRSVRQLADRLNEIPNVHAETAANLRRETAVAWLKRALDSDHDGQLSEPERASAQVILYGQSLGGAAAIETARDLEHLGIAVMLTVQVDSVGLHDDWIPPNVQEAVNFYQHDPLTFQGETNIRAEDPSRTHVLGNFRMSYRSISVDQSESTWVRRTFGGSHARMEADPVLWKQVERYITVAISKTRL